MTIYFNDIPFEEIGERIGQSIDFNEVPDKEGVIVGYNPNDMKWWLVRLNNHAQEYAVVSEQVMQNEDAVNKWKLSQPHTKGNT